MDAFLAALADPVRLEMVKRLARSHEPVACAAVYDGIAKSTASHHFRVLQTAGIISTAPAGAGRKITLADSSLPPERQLILRSILAAV